MIIDIPDEVKHWHGAQRDSWFQHLTTHVATGGEQSNELMEQREQSDARISSAEIPEPSSPTRSLSRQKSSETQWLEPVNDDIYDSLK